MADHHHRHHHPSMRDLGHVGKACKHFVSKCYQDDILSPRKSKTKDRQNTSIQDKKFKDKKKWDEEVNDNMNCKQIRHNGDVSHWKRITNNNLKHLLATRTKSSPIPTSASASKRSLTSTRGNHWPNLSRSWSSTSSMDHGSNISFSSVSRKVSTAIMYSNSNGIIKPPAMEMTLECTLEELCFGCAKDVNIIRDTLTNDGDVIQVNEVLTIKVNPGWTKGTKVTFEGMGNKMPGALPSDVVVTIAEKEHPLYRHEGDDLELAMKVPLVKALTGCTLAIPFLGGEKMDFTLDDIIYPGYTTIIPGQGMPNSQDQGKRGDLAITFLVEFPKDLTDAQRSDIVSILQDS